MSDTWSEYDPIHLRYRPRTLGQLVGQREVVETLRGMFQERKLARTFFTFGPYGCGKTTTARLIARYVNCEQPEENSDPCGKCASCQAMDRKQNRDVIEINCGDKRGIDDIRGLLKTVRFAPQRNYRVFILDEVHQLTPQAMQALFKDLEEPPKRTIFVLCTTEPDRIIGQIPSRAIKLPIQKVSAKITAKLCAHIFRNECKKKVKPAVFLEIAKAVDGHPRDALTVLESVINQVNQGSFKTATLTKAVARTVRRVVPGNPDQFAKIIMLSIYKGQYTRAIDSVRKYQSSGGRLVRLLDVCLRFHAEAIALRCSPKLASPYYADWYKLLDGNVIGETRIQVSVMSQILDYLVACQSQLKSYLVDEYYVTLSAVTKSVNLVQSVTLPPGKKR